MISVALALFAAIFFVREAVSEGPGTTQPQAQGSTTTSLPPDLSTSTSTLPPVAETRAGYLTSREGAVLHATPGDTGLRIAGGITFPILETTADSFRVLDVCGRQGWLTKSDVIEGMVPVNPAQGMEGAVFVIDAGHGYPDLGAVGPTRLFEAVANLDVVARLAELLRAPRDVDWATGEITPGSTYPATTAILTRSPDGPNDGDFEMSLVFRAEVANSADATALISIHHNSFPSRDLDHPGSEAYVQIANPESARLGGLIVEELRKELAQFNADWKGGPGAGLRSRLGSDGGDYYTLLDEAEGVAVIVEGAYISNASEEAVIRTDAFRQAYAEAVYRAIVRWTTTTDDPIPAPNPEAYTPPSGPGRDWDNCVVPPAQ